MSGGCKGRVLHITIHSRRYQSMGREGHNAFTSRFSSSSTLRQCDLMSAANTKHQVCLLQYTFLLCFFHARSKFTSASVALVDEADNNDTYWTRTDFTYSTLEQILLPPPSSSLRRHQHSILYDHHETCRRHWRICVSVVTEGRW
eukprot:scaffold258_cov201-Alexandrium_tamarense.AAC.8